MGRSRLGGVATVLAPSRGSTQRQLALGISSPAVALVREVLLPGAVKIAGWVSHDAQRSLAAGFRQWALPPAGLRRPRVPSGHLMSVQSVCLGWHWEPYAYSRTADDTDGAPVKPLPVELADLARAAVADWTAISQGLDDHGSSLTGPVLEQPECKGIVELYRDDRRFRSTIDMARYRFGQGQYRYFDRPLPKLVAELRAAFWPHLLPIARAWAGRLGQPAPWPDSLDDWLEQCHQAGQTRPTPLLLRYGPGDWNALHRDLYGELVFPLQVVIGLDRPGVDYTGGEFITLEQRARAQSRGTTSAIAQGEGLVFTTRDRPVPSRRGWSAAPMRHGVSVLRSGRRHTLGLVFHDAR
jgi:hypothetical protein